jgi:hypothetical protein
MSRFSQLPDRVIVPNRPYPRRVTRAELLVSFAAACILIAFILIVLCCIRSL